LAALALDAPNREWNLPHQLFGETPNRATGTVALPFSAAFPGYLFGVGFTFAAVAILAAVEGGILPPVLEVRNGSAFLNHTPIPPGRIPGSTAGKVSV
jgi:hypothetical protein